MNLAIAILLAMAWDGPVSCMPNGYEASRAVSPSHLEGDFDGDGKLDTAVVVTRRGEQGVVICRGNGMTPIVLGAGASFNAMRNLDFTGWRIHPKNRRAGRGAGAGRPPILSGDALLLEWESGSGIVYWNGARFVWYQQGD